MTAPTAPGWPWPPELDALTAAPAFHDLLFENEHVRVLEAHVGPGQTVPVHTHCWPGVLYILGVSDSVRSRPRRRRSARHRGHEPRTAGLEHLGRGAPTVFFEDCRGR